MKVSVAVMAHPSRADMVDELTAALDRPAEVVWDEKSDRWDTGRRAWLTYDPGADYHLVIQDDAIVCRDVVAGLEEALERTPEMGHPVSLYVGRVKPYAAAITEIVEQADDETASWLEMGDINWGVAIALPTYRIDAAIAWGDDNIRRNVNYDRNLSRHFVGLGLTCYYTWPSLVDHRLAPSLIGHGDHRQAHSFLGADASAIGLDWGGPTIEMTMDRRRPGVGFRHVRTGRTVVVSTDRSQKYARSSSWEAHGRCPSCGRR